jgi:MFS family permease
MTNASGGGETIAKAYAWYALFLLSLINVINYLDRNIIFALFEPIKRDLSLTDTQLGWLGSAYVVVYALAAIPMGVLADLKSRRAVIATGVTVWSAFTAVAGLTRTFWQLFFCRAMVGVGEASYTPASQSLIADYFPGKGRAFALGIFWGGLAMGGVLGIWLGGELESLYGWRVAFMAVGIPGIILAVLASQLKDPSRARAVRSLRENIRQLEFTAARLTRATWPTWSSGIVGGIAAYFLDRHTPATSDMDAAVFSIVIGIGLTLNVVLWVRADRTKPPVTASGVGGRSARVEDFLHAGRVVLRTPTLIWLFIAGALISFAMNGLVGWSPSYMQRELWLTPQLAGRTVGLWGLLAAVLGTVFGGRLADHLAERWSGGRILVGAAGFLIGAPLAIWLLMVRDLDLFIPLFFVTIFFFTWYHGPMTAAIFDVVPAAVGASVIGAYVFFTHIAGTAIALPLVGFLSDEVSLRFAMMVLPASAFAGGAIALVALRTARRDAERAHRATGEWEIPS